MSKFHTKRGVPMSAAMSLVLEKAQAQGYELKSLVHGVRIMGTDVVCSDTWNGLYLCRTKTSGFVREDLGVAQLKPADQGCWRVCVDSYATDPEGAAQQVKNIAALAAKKGYLVGLFEDEQAEVEAPAEEVVEVAAPEEPKVAASPKERAMRRKKGKAKPKVEDEAKFDALDAAIANL
jgi:hypothetical protein